ncbi:TPA: restriction endonuclease subunit S, partial [Pseudomonas aeruginosa]
LPEQKRIAAILDKADAIRRKRQQAIQLADDFLRAVFLDMFGDPVTNPKGWETFALADVVRKDSIITYGIVQAGEHVDGGVPYIRTGDFKGGRLVRSGYACTSTDIASKFKRSEVAPGDIVYCIRASVGSADVVPEFLAGANLTQGTAKISPAHDMKAEFLVELLRSAGFRSWIDKNSKGATFKEITLARLREAPVFKPPMFEQEAFVRVKEIVMERLVGKFQEADVPLFESLSQKAFSGQL